MSAQTITNRGFLAEFARRHTQLPDHPFCFVLGAGASKQSGIPSGGEMVSQWLREMHEMEDQKNRKIEEWATAENLGIKDFDYKRAAKFYSQIYRRRYTDFKEQGYAFLEKALDGKEPSFGYSVLSQILATTQHKVAITTNFDNLIADALAIYMRTYPLICGHESLTGFIRPNPRRPIVAKIHRDLLLQPKSDPEEIAVLTNEWADALKRIFERCTPIVIGYDGNDGSLMGFLESLATPIEGGIFWCHRQGSIPDERVQRVVEKHHGRLVPIIGYDEVMLQLQEELKLSSLLPEMQKREKERVTEYQKQFETLTTAIRAPGTSAADEKAKEPVREAAKAAVERITKEKSWWAWQLKAKQEKDPIKQEAIYREGIADFPESAELPCYFALFLHDVRKNYDEAEKFYRKALELKPNEAYCSATFAVFVEKIRKNYDEAEKLYRKAMELDPNNANNTGNFALFLNNIRKNYDEVEKLYRKALELDPNHAGNTGNFARFIADIRKNYDEAEKLYRKALELDPNPNGANNTGNFARFMEYIRKNYDEAEKLYRKALELDPKHAINTGNFAFFLKNIRKNYDEAEKLYRKAMELDPNNASNTGNLAVFLKNIRKSYDEAEKLYRKALELDPNNATNTGNIARFIEDIRKNYDEAEKLYRKALELDPKDATNTGNFARFMEDIRKNYDEAEKLYRKALELDPNHATNTGNFARFMDDIRKKYDEAEKLYRRALELDPKNEGRRANLEIFLKEQKKR